VRLVGDDYLPRWQAAEGSATAERIFCSNGDRNDPGTVCADHVDGDGRDL
jgi:hypothetical protein